MVSVAILLMVIVGLRLLKPPRQSLVTGYWLVHEITHELNNWLELVASQDPGYFAVRSGEAHGSEWFYLYLLSVDMHVSPIPQDRTVHISLDEARVPSLPVVFYIQSVNRALRYIRLDIMGASVRIDISDIPTLVDARLLQVTP